MKKTILFCISILYITSCEKPIEGCMNPLADNYNPQAEREDHSCDYTQWSLLAQNKLDLCGIWFGYGYSCGGPIPVEVIQIQNMGNSLIKATKIIGDDCVCSGDVTWEGIYNSNPFNVLLYLGGGCGVNFPMGENGNLSIELITPNRIILHEYGEIILEFIRATTKEIEELDLNINLEEICKPQS
tara:strand:- start:16 stop:570 length:555 start_codon:yes stop_codon:yes gene_type:complete